MVEMSIAEELWELHYQATAPAAEYKRWGWAQTRLGWSAAPIRKCVTRVWGWVRQGQCPAHNGMSESQEGMQSNTS